MFLSISGLREDDHNMNSPLLWLRGDTGDRGIQSLNYHGIGVTPWMQPRFDASMIGLQTDMYQAMAAAALQEMRGVDPSKLLPTSLLQFQQTQNLSSRSAALMQPQMVQESQSQQAFLQGVEEIHRQSHSQTPTQLHLQHQNSFSNQQQQILDHQQIPSAISSMNQFASASQSRSPSFQVITSLCQQQSFPDSNGNSATSTTLSPLSSLMGSFSQDESSNLLNVPRTNPLLSSSGWPSKRAAIEPLLSSGVSQCVLPQVEQLGPPQTTISHSPISLPPFPGRECSIDQEGSTDPQTHLLFGINMSNLRAVGSDSVSTTIHFPSNYMSTTETDFSLNPAVTPSNCIDESGFLQSPENVGHENQPNGNFVKVSSF